MKSENGKGVNQPELMPRVKYLLRVSSDEIKDEMKSAWMKKQLHHKKAIVEMNYKERNAFEDELISTFILNDWVNKDVVVPGTYPPIIEDNAIGLSTEVFVRFKGNSKPAIAAYIYSEHKWLCNGNKAPGNSVVEYWEFPAHNTGIAPLSITLQ